MTLAYTNQGDILGIKVVNFVNISSNASRIGTNGSQNQQILQVTVVREIRSLEDNALEQGNQFTWQIGSHEGFDSAAHFISAVALRQSPLNNLINELTTLTRLRSILVLVQNLGPKIQILTFHEVLRQITVQTMSMGNLNKVIITLSSTLLVRHKGETRIQTLAVRTQNLRVIKHIVQQECLGILVQGNVNLTQSIVRSWLGRSGSNTGLEPLLQHAQTVASLGNFHHLVNGTGRSDCHQNTLNKILVTTQVKQFTDNLRRLARRNLGHVDFNVLQQRVLVEVLRQLIDKIVAIANVDKRTRIRQTGVLQVVLHLLWIVNGTITAYTFRLLELTKHARGLNVLEVHNRILTEINNCAEEVVQALGSLVRLKDLDQILATKLLVVLLGNLDTHLYISGSTTEHILEQHEALLLVQLGEKAHDEFGRHLMRVLKYALNIIDVGVVFRCTLPHGRLLAHLSNVGTIVVRQETLLHNRVSHLWESSRQVYLQYLGLQVSMVGIIVLESFQQKGGSLLNAVARQKCLGSGANVNQRTTLCADKTLGEVKCSSRVGEQQLIEHGTIVHLVSHTAAVRNDFIVFTALHKALNSLRVALATEVNRECHASINGHNQVS
mmetsp:Transcript_6019/g.8839  ORF Transcript_6019/g.8839 Transcript_6019/m.8839 type:complete len:610 (+) Transcript_6019:2100-3929(+)